MGVFKEHAHAFETVARHQDQIWNDSCDYGYAYNTANPPQEIKDLLFFVKDLKGTSLQRKYSSYPEIGHVSATFRIGWEIDEGMECGTQYRVSFQKITSNRFNLRQPDADAFITVDIESYREPYRNR